jgi:hypothetical protein
MLMAVAIDEEMASFICPSLEVPAPPVELPGRFFSGEDKVGSSVKHDENCKKINSTHHLIA